jgi:hypothetical protein
MAFLFTYHNTTTYSSGNGRGAAPAARGHHAPRRPRRAPLARQKCPALGPAPLGRRPPPCLDRRQAHQGRRRRMGRPPRPSLPVPALPPDRHLGHRRPPPRPSPRSAQSPTAPTRERRCASPHLKVSMNPHPSPAAQHIIFVCHILHWC